MDGVQVLEITRDEVVTVADLARLKLTEDEIVLYSNQLNSILEYIHKLNEVDTSNVPPTASVLPLKNVLRDDKVGPTLTPDQVVANAADAEDNQFKVSAVLDNS